MLRNTTKKPLHLQPPSKLIIDTHGGLQDILAIVFAYRYIKKQGSHQEIIGITCVTGKNHVDDAVKSALVANKILGTNIPVYRGQQQSMLLEKEYPKVYADQKFTHVEKALFKQIEHDQQIHKLVQKENAIDFLIQACAQHNKNLGIVAFGSVTNLGLVHRLENSLQHIKMLSLMGGQLLGMGTTVKGNVQPNFAHDPLAADVLFEKRQSGQNLPGKIYVNPIEQTLTFCFKQGINMCLDTGKVDPAIEQILINMMGINSIVLNCGPLLTILPFLNPKSVKNHYHLYAEIIMDSGTLDGLLAINWLKVGAFVGQFESFFYLYEDFDKDIINELLVQAFTTS